MLGYYLHKSKELFQIKIQKCDREDFLNGIHQLNATRGKLISTIFLIIESFQLIATIIMKKEGIFQKPNLYYELMYLIMIPTMVIFLLLFHIMAKDLPKHVKGNINLSILFTIFVLCWCAGMSLLDQMSGGEVLIYMISIIAVAVTPIFRPLFIVIIYLTVHTFFVYFLLSFHASEDRLIGDVIKSTAIIIISGAIAFMRYKNRAEDYISKKLLRESAVELKRLNLELEMANHKLEVLSITDGLTGIYNRFAFDMILNKEWKQCRQQQQHISLIMIDIDFFKAFNDNYGHQAGDVCLKRVAEVLSTGTESDSDTVVRYGGEEFAIILPAMEEEDAKAFAERMRISIEDMKIRHEHSDISNYVTISLGVHTMKPHEQVSIEEFIRTADIALYRAKKISRNRVVVA